VQLTEVPVEWVVCFPAEVLISEHEQTSVGECLVQVAELSVAERQRAVEPPHLGAR